MEETFRLVYVAVTQIYVNERNWLRNIYRICTGMFPCYYRVITRRLKAHAIFLHLYPILDVYDFAELVVSLPEFMKTHGANFAKIW